MNGVSVTLLLLMGLMLMYDGYCVAAREDNSMCIWVQSGIASWYGREEQGSSRPTASISTGTSSRPPAAASRSIPSRA